MCALLTVAILVVAMLVSSTNVRLGISSVVVSTSDLRGGISSPNLRGGISSSNLRGGVSSPDLRGSISTANLGLSIVAVVVVAVVVSTMVVGLIIPVVVTIIMAISWMLVVGIVGVVVLVLCWQTGTLAVRRLTRWLGYSGLVAEVSQEDSVGFVAARIVLVVIATDLGLEITRRLFCCAPQFFVSVP